MKTRLDIRGFGGRVVPNSLYRLEPPSTRVMLVFPGWAYTVEAPLLFYMRLLAEELGADVLVLDYGYDRLEGFAEISEDEQDEWFGREVQAAFDAVRHYGQFTLVGKSIGTQAIGELLANQPVLGSAAVVLLTPTLSEPRFRGRLETIPNRCLTIIGSCDPAYTADNIELARRLGDLHIVGDADHSLNIRGSLSRSIDELANVIERARTFLANAT